MLRYLSNNVLFPILASVSGAILLCCTSDNYYTVKIEYVSTKSPEDIVLQNDSLVRPLIYQHITGLENLPVTKAKSKFIAAVLPSILVAKFEVQTSRKKLMELREKSLWNREDSIFYKASQKRYSAKNIDELISKMITLPNSLVLAQAAAESGWGQSRFFREANNLFGIWSVRKTDRRIAAKNTRKEKTVFVRSYGNILESARDYFLTLARSRAYKALRKSSIETSDPFTLAKHLNNYSERKTQYTNELKKIISQNNLTQFDRYTLDPEYLIPEERTEGI